MKLQDLVDGFVARRASGGLFLLADEVLSCVIAATGHYLAYGSLAADPEMALDGVDGNTVITAGEWGVIRPLFELLVEKESGLRAESSRGQGLDVPGRSTSEIEQDIQRVLDALPLLAFSEGCVSIGMDE